MIRNPKQLRGLFLESPPFLCGPQDFHLSNVSLVIGSRGSAQCSVRSSQWKPNPEYVLSAFVHPGGADCQLNQIANVQAEIGFAAVIFLTNRKRPGESAVTFWGANDARIPIVDCISSPLLKQAESVDISPDPNYVLAFIRTPAFIIPLLAILLTGILHLLVSLYYLIRFIPMLNKSRILTFVVILFELISSTLKRKTIEFSL